MLPLSVHMVAWPNTRVGLPAASQLGFRSAEVFAYGLWAHNAADISAWLDNGRLTLSAVSFELPDDPGAARVAASRAAASAAAFGATRLIVTANGDNFDRAAATIAVAGAASATAGVRLCLHPHPNTAVETAAQTAAILAATDPEQVWVCVDTGHLLAAGDDPVAAIAAWTARLAAVHLKDVDDHGRLVAAGLGRLPLTETLAAVDTAVAAGAPVEHLTLEYEGRHPEAALVASATVVNGARRTLGAVTKR